MFARLRSLIRALLCKRRMDAEMDEEMRTHLELRIQANIKDGMSPEQARYAALRSFGWTESIKETCRDQRRILWLEESVQDVRFGMRMLVKSPVFTMAVLFTVALGIGANTAIFSVVQTVLLRPLPYPDPQQLVMLWERSPHKGLEKEFVTPPNFMDWKAEQRSFEEMAYWTGPMEFNLVNPNGTEKINCVYALSSLFRTLKVSPQMGRAFLPEEDVPQGNRVAVISHSFWQRRFGGDHSALGRTITLDTYGRREYTIVGIMPPKFGFPDDCDVWLPAGWNGLPRDRRGGHWLSVMGRLKPGVTGGQAEAELSAIQARIAQLHPNSIVGSEVAVVPLLEQTVGKNVKVALMVLWALVVSVLLIACANVANLLLVRAASRQKETAIRMAMGASRGRLTKQLLTESLLLSLIGGVLGVGLAFWSLHLLVAMGSDHIPRLSKARLESVTLLFTLMVSVLTGLLFGLAPAWQCSRTDVISRLKDSDRSSTLGVQDSRIRNSLVAAQVALSLVALVGAALMAQSLLRLMRVDRGFQPEHLLTAQLDFSISGFTTWVQPTATRPQVTLQEILDRLKHQPGVISVAAVSALPRNLGVARTQSFIIQDSPVLAQDGQWPTANFIGISPDYFRVMGVSLVRGRSFSESDTYESGGVVIINETLAKRYFPNEDPIGKRIAIGHRSILGKPAEPNPGQSSPWGEIVGIVRDMKKLNMSADTTPDIFVPYWQWPMQNPALIVRITENATGMADIIRTQVKAAHQMLPDPKFEPMEKILSEAIAQPRFHTILASLFGFAALVLSTVGIYGVTSYYVTQRRNEIGIRLALGAQKRDILSLVIGQGMKLALVGVVFGLPVAFSLARVLSSLLYEGEPRNLFIFSAVPLLFLIIAFFACWLPARLAAKFDPMSSLRRD